MPSQVSTPTAPASKQALAHPLAPLTAEEITTTSRLVREAWPAGTGLQFKQVTLEEPPRAEVLRYLDAEHEGRSVPVVVRKAFVCYYFRKTNKFHEAIVDLSAGRVERNVRLGPNVHGNGDGEEIIAMERICLDDEKVQAEIAKLELPEGTVVIVDPWIYGSDGVGDDDRMYQCFMYMRDPKNPSEADSNHYAFPLPISPVVSTESMKVIRVDLMPTGTDNTIRETRPIKIQPPNEYLPEYQELRKDLKPLHVIQPEGASFTVKEQGTSSVIEWQKWSFRVGFNQREGTVLHDVRYDGISLFYRLSLSDMCIPYADPRHPYHKKAAFDLGDAGAGLMANNLKLGCDCLGSIYYLSAVLSSDEGEPLPMPNVICVHEQDAGIGWKHSNYRTGRAAVARSRELVVQTIMTVANYEYIVAFIFNQAAELHYEVRATGILSTQPINEGVEVPFGTIVHPGVLATHHQHIFSLRIDPLLHGPGNQLAQTTSHAMPRSQLNPHGTGYYTKNEVIAKAGGYDLDLSQNKTFKIQNPSVRNAVNGHPVGYKIALPDFQKMLADRDSYHFRRAEFADHNLYVVAQDPSAPYSDTLYAGGKYTNQSRGGAGVRAWSSGKADILDKDIAVFLQFGINHVPRAEDFPVMPCEIIKLGLKPVDFFPGNPASDVPPSAQAENGSTLLDARGKQAAPELHRQPGLQGVLARGDGLTCCDGNATNGVNGLAH